MDVVTIGVTTVAGLPVDGIINMEGNLYLEKHQVNLIIHLYHL
jgi:hypothetical protein